MSDEKIMNVSLSDQNIACISVKLEKLMSTETNDKIDIYHSYIKDGKNAARQGDMSKAVDFFKLAHKIQPSEKLKIRIQKIEELIAEQASDSEDEVEEFVNINNSGLMLFKELHDKLYEHQREGVSFMYSLHRDGLKGGILADDMGLGKTIQVIAFLSGMYDADLVKHTLLVMPTSLITNWTKEFATWTPGMRVKEFHGTSKVERTRNMEKVQKRGGVVITTYQMLILNWQQIASYNGREFKWDYMILDEAHKIKTSSTKTAKSARAIPAHNRVLLTGTPVQNNLREMWALFDFACQGALLGTSKTFKTEYENPITRAREKDATPGEKALGLKMSQNLIDIIQPYFLRRTKADVQKKNSEMEKEQRKTVKTENGDIQVSDTEKYNGAIMPELRRKNDLIIWTYLSDVQEDIYRQFISLDHIKELLTTTKSPLAELNVIKKLCDHPRLLSAAAMAHMGLQDSTPEGQQAEDDKETSHSLDNIPDDKLIAESGKMVFLMALLERLRVEGHRTLVFAHFRKVLDILERVLGNRGFKTIRLDGTITKLDERERLISLFQNDKRYSVFLLTTQVGGVGITLTAADRVVIYDPSWNPATDAQAVDRAYRIGQKENVVIYRLITCGTVEEKIYRRQVFKDSIIRQTTGDKKNPFRYFSKQELKELFTLQETRSSSTQLQLQSLHSRHRRTDPMLDEHIAYLHSMEMFGISDHDLMFSLDSNQNDEEDPEDQEAQQYIEGRVRKAEELMKAESELQMQLAENMESSTEPAWHRQPTQPDRERSHGRQEPKRKPRSPVVHNEDSSDGSPVVVELDQSGSDKDSKLTNTNGFIDLTVDMEEKQPDLSPDTTEPNASPSQHSFTVEQSEVKAEAISVHNVSSDMESDDATSEYNAILDGSVSGDIHDGKRLNQESFRELDNSKNQATAMEEEPPLDEPLLGQRLSVLQISNVSLNDEEASMSASGVKSFEGNFNLLLEDSENDISTVHDLLEEPDVEAQEMKLLSELQIKGSFNVDKSLAEFKQEHGMSLNLNSYVSESDQSDNESLIMNKKKRVAVISDSEEEGEKDEELQRISRNLSDSFQALESSTPKTLPSGRTPLQARRSFGGNISVASRRSMIESIVEDVDNDLDFEEEEEEQFSENGSGVVDGDSEETSVHSVDKLEIDETKGETILTESEEDENDQETDVSALGAPESGGDVKSMLEESSGSDQSFDSEGKSYEELVCRGKQYYGEGKLQDALDLFLKALDISSGDTEVQLLVIQLYRQMSEERR